MWLPWLALVWPSLAIVYRVGGWAGVCAYVLVSLPLVVGITRLRLTDSPRRVAVLSVATWFALVVIFAVVYPRVNAQMPGFGSDDDDAYNVGARALLAGASPYASVTYLGNPLHQLPGAFLLAMPFVLMGTSALQNLFWLPVFFEVLARETSNRVTALRSSWLMLLAAPVVLHQVVTGTGHVANTLYVLTALWWLTRTSGLFLPSLCLGVAMASRANFLLLMPLAAGWLVQSRGWRVALTSAAVTTFTVAALTVPFYLHDPVHFGPLQAADRLTRVDQSIPHGGAIVGAITALVAVVTSCVSMTRARLFGFCALVQALPVLLVSAIELWTGGSLDFSYWTYGVFAMPFVVAMYAFSTRSAMKETVTLARVAV